MLIKNECIRNTTKRNAVHLSTYDATTDIDCLREIINKH